MIGLSRGFALTLPTLVADERCRLAGAADPREEARRMFEAEFDAPAYADAEALCADPGVEVVYIASPHQFHCRQAVMAARAGKHVWVEKPMAIRLAECAEMIAAAKAAGVCLVVGPSHGFDPPIVAAAEMIAEGGLGAVRMMTAINYTDFLYRARRPEELDTSLGGGVVFSQASHQIDMVRRLVGHDVRGVRARTGVWDAQRPTEGAYQAFLIFENGCCATLAYSGYGRYDSDALMGGVGETGHPKDPGGSAWVRARPADADEPALKRRRAYGYRGDRPPPPVAHEHFGFVLVSCERADLRLTAAGVEIHDRGGRRMVTPPLSRPSRAGVIDELWAAIREQRRPLHDGVWGRANLAICLAILKSAALDAEVLVADLEKDA